MQWASSHNSCWIFDGQQMASKFKNFDAVIAVGKRSLLKSFDHNALDQLQTFINQSNDWLMCCLSYDLKNPIENLSSNNFDGINFPQILAVQPQKVFTIKDSKLECYYPKDVSREIETDFTKIRGLNINLKLKQQFLDFNSRLSKETYLSSINQLKSHIKRGDIYEINFCQEFYTHTPHFYGFDAFKQLNHRSKAPFSAFVKFDEFQIVSASPERFLTKKDFRLLSQPIKGTAKRGQSLVEDQNLIKELATDPKELAENIMIVDLVRNDLSKLATKASVNVDELCNIYTFEQVHQMISTISCELKPNINFTSILEATFPMGSMTGAPKIEAMKLAESFETTKRGLYSGSIGYITPNGDFDFNVVIRSLLYNAKTAYLSYMVGSAITDQSIPENEYNECLLKGKALQEIFCKA
ncbi:anthranilate synthase component I family protein [Psychroflexus sp. ALD_RP9]|uniref:anthranilate synthase component I family protein n=1 Tax=Psychroflexus sp. ALD_RP9 TaxID=2777186 RepID=UPI001F5D7DFD|nr:anthranilate synthase component I family protein [Psychroflexus sp. ALD_RP9]